MINVGLIRLSGHGYLCAKLLSEQCILAQCWVFLFKLGEVMFVVTVYPLYDPVFTVVACLC